MHRSIHAPKEEINHLKTGLDNSMTGRTKNPTFSAMSRFILLIYHVKYLTFAN